jgi:hypothetical protein
VTSALGQRVIGDPRVRALGGAIVRVIGSLANNASASALLVDDRDAPNRGNVLAMMDRKNAEESALACRQGVHNNGKAVAFVGRHLAHGVPFIDKAAILPRSHLQQFNRSPQPRRCLTMVSSRQALIGEVVRVDDLRLVAGIAEPVAFTVNLGNAAHEVTIRVARLPVVRVVDADDRADVPVEVAAFGALPPPHPVGRLDPI